VEPDGRLELRLQPDTGTADSGRVMHDLAFRVAAVLPHGRQLPEAVWRRRHRIIVRLAFVQAVGLGLLAWAWGHGFYGAAEVTLLVAAPLLVSVVSELPRGARSAAATVSLIGASVALVQLWQGVTEAHFHFFVMVGVVSLYQDWVPFGIALLVTVAHHGIAGTLAPHAVFGTHSAQHDPWVWAGIHGAFVLAASLAHLGAWRLNEEQVLQDRLTGLANRTSLEETAGRLLGGDGDVSLMVLDLDDFKDLNDTRGHGAGDELLAVVAERLRGCVRAGDLVARLGGDEFAVVVPDGARVARAVGERVLAALTTPAELTDGTVVSLRGSLGIATPADEGERTLSALLRNADLAMYLAKSQGKDRLVVYAEGMAEDARRRTELQHDLAAAAATGQLRVHYQPTVYLEDGEITGFEALVRWEHPERGLVPPVEFVPLAEETGAIVGIGRWVLQQAVVQGAAWSVAAGRPLKMSVNLSPRQLMDDDVPALVREVLADTGFPARQLTLEVTEGVLVHDVERVVAQLHELRGLGVRIAIDDFGTGFSSLSYLRRLPADVLKIDRSFVVDLTAGGSSTSLVSSIIELARTLGLDVIAEGVETEEQRVALQDLQCGQAQGYLFARPQPADSFEESFTAAPAAQPA
jgi:diguanylate cyclase (GGDEF)-like protein